MYRSAIIAGLLSVGALLAPATADAAKKKVVKTVPETSQSVEHRASIAYRRGPQVRGFVQRRGGYSYGAADSINTYGDSKTIFGGSGAYSSYQFNQQSQGGPFDSGFFFDSGIGPRGGNSPYQN
jgi:hypothetical protein